MIAQDMGCTRDFPKEPHIALHGRQENSLCELEASEAACSL